MKRAPLLYLAVCIALLSCCSPAKKPPRAHDSTPRGGTLRVVEPLNTAGMATVDPHGSALDPQLEYEYSSWELFRCCLMRTLLSHSGRTTNEGGAVLLPDLAARMPDVSPDGLTWTFTLKPRIHYAPPLQDVVVTSTDFVRAFDREAKLINNFYGPRYLSVIKGFVDYVDGKKPSIIGVETPDPTTLVFHLNEPAGDLGDRLSLPMTAPIPPLPSDPSAPLGIATGHDDGYGPYLVSVGPYMLEGTDKLDFTKPPAMQPRATGFSPGKEIVLVRNPSWNPATDGLRAAYVDRIEIRFPRGDRTSAATLATTGHSDVDLSTLPAEPSLLALARTAQQKPALGAVHEESSDFVRYVSMNLALPPFDDVHVRRALNWLIDKNRILAMRGGSLGGSVAGHSAFDSMEQNILISYHPWTTPNDGGDLSRAKQEMAQSRYDGNHDGVCDAPACRSIVGLAVKEGNFPAVGRELAHEMLLLGIHVNVVALDRGEFFHRTTTPEAHVAISLTSNWGKDYLNASNLFQPLFASSALGGANQSLIGASPDQLRGWGYPIRTVPTVDDRIDECSSLTGVGQLHCWVSLDEYVTEQVVPWVPLIFEANPILTSTRVVAFSFDQFANEPALDRIALKPGS
jgi:peptide/nickel transport system substrate-binding protein